MFFQFYLTEDYLLIVLKVSFLCTTFSCLFKLWNWSKYGHKKLVRFLYLIFVLYLMIYPIKLLRHVGVCHSFVNFSSSKCHSSQYRTRKQEVVVPNFVICSNALELHILGMTVSTIRCKFYHCRANSISNDNL